MNASRKTWMVSLLCLMAAAVPQAHAADETAGYVDVAAAHCKAWLGGDQADMSFALGGAASRFSDAQLTQFNQAFGAKLRGDFGVASVATCDLKEVSAKSLVTHPHKPAVKRNRRAVPQREEAVVSAVLAGEDGVPVAIAYRLEQADTGRPWVIRSLSINGEPMVDRYRERYEAIARRNGAQAVLSQF